MPTILSHPAPVMLISTLLPHARTSWRLFFTAIFFTILPDFDVIGFKFGISYASSLGHRGFSHSLLFALCSGAFGALCANYLNTSRAVAFLALFMAVASHITLDAMTTGGLGVAFLWPLTETRYFLPWRPILVSPFSPKAFLTPKGWAVLQSEFYWVWLPSAVMASFIWLNKKILLTPKSTFSKK